MGKVLWNKQTGEAAEYDGVDAREILATSPDLYTDVDPNARKKGDPDGDGYDGAPQNVANVENEFRREPVGDNPPATERDQVVIRNPVSDVPKMAPAPGEANATVGGVAASAARAEAEAAADPLDHDKDGKKGGSLPKADKK